MIKFTVYGSPLNERLLERQLVAERFDHSTRCKAEHQSEENGDRQGGQGLATDGQQQQSETQTLEWKTRS